MVNDERLEKIKEEISEYIRNYTIDPSMISIEKNVYVPYRIGDAKLLLQVSTISIDANCEKLCASKLNKIKPIQEPARIIKIKPGHFLMYFINEIYC